MLASLIEKKTRFESRAVRAVTVADVAVRHTELEGTVQDRSDKSASIRSEAIEVLGRQDDGSWKQIVGDPNARGWDGVDRNSNATVALGVFEEVYFSAA